MATDKGAKKKAAVADIEDVDTVDGPKTHYQIGQEQKLFMFDELSPGSCFFLPAGTHIYNTLMSFMRQEYQKRGFQEVITPNIFNKKLWETSGHWYKYKQNMFVFNIKNDAVDGTDGTDGHGVADTCPGAADGTDADNGNKNNQHEDHNIFAMKAMNCPAHCLMFKHMNLSYKDLPLRLADFGVLHRNEASGALRGLTRVRRFCQDDCHIFCTKEQLHGELVGALRFLKDVYTIFGFSFDIELSTKPEEYIGSDEVWAHAEQILKEVLINNFGDKWKLNEGDGAFYGPKIDIHIKDSANRSYQCATIQLDFNLPDRFDLSYQTANVDSQYDRPIIIHRAIYGSLERFFGILCEHYQGKWPLWLSPRQVAIVPISNKFGEYCDLIYEALKKKGYMVRLDDSDNTFNKKVRNAEVDCFNYILVIGKKECSDLTVNVRQTNKVIGAMTLDSFVELMNEGIANYC